MDPSSKRKGSKRKRNQTPSQDLQTTTRKKQKTQATVTSTEIQQENRYFNFQILFFWFGSFQNLCIEDYFNTEY